MCRGHGNLKSFNLYAFLKNKTSQNLTLTILPYLKLFEDLFERTNRFKAFLILTLVIEYIEYIAVILFNHLYPKPSPIGKTLFVVFHVTFSMAIISYIKCCTKNAGNVPIHWAFYRGDVLKRQRYCKICNLWKPERTHHCSICNRCVLNMDHHCPWFENCIGFYNRRFFMLLLFYSILGLGIITIHRIFYLYTLLRHTPSDYFSYPFFFYNFWIRIMLTVLMSVFSFLFLIALTQFSYFHIYLIAKNSTTIENLSSSLASSTPYNVGVFRNFQQVFGSQPWLWWIPLDTKFTTPLGDGVYWI